MVYPIFRNKHLYGAVVEPIDFVKYARYPKNIPKNLIITYRDTALKYFKRKYETKPIKLHTDLIIYKHKNIGLIKLRGIGSSNAVAVLEELIALGAKTFLNIGTAGGLYREGTFLCIKALRDEGTSYHYILGGKFSYPNEELTSKFAICMENQGIIFSKGTTWTTDAPYRETKREIEYYSKQGISTIDMETAALFVLARYRNVKVASAFVVGDILEKDVWKPMFLDTKVKKVLKQLVDACVECLRV